MCQQVTETGKPALTHYRTLRTGTIAGQTVSLLALTLATGRTHQIRVHLAHLGHPLLGDDLYGGDTRLIPRQALHAYQLTFPSTSPRPCPQIWLCSYAKCVID